MKTIRLTTLAILGLAGGTVMLPAAEFTSGSDGSYGPMNITTHTRLPMPSNGVFHCTTISIADGASLAFVRNPLNTPVYLLATGDVVINGTIDVSGQQGGQGNPGQGGPGGFDGGSPGNSSGDTPGDGHGPGAGLASRSVSDQAGWGSYGTRSTRTTNDGATYGSPLLQPLVGGSGGGGTPGNPGYGGGGGGGAILIASTTSILHHGYISANGAGSSSSSGSGGAIRIVAPRFQGIGSITARSTSLEGGQGRIRVDVPDRSGWSFTFQGKVSIGSRMVVFPPVVPRLDILEAAGQAIPFGTTSAVSIDLSSTASTNQTVKIRATDFTGVVPISVVVVPDSGPSSSFPASLDLTAGNVAETNVNVILTPGALNRIYCWTR